MRKSIEHNVKVVKDNSLGVSALNMSFYLLFSLTSFFPLPLPPSLPHLLFQSSFLLYMLRDVVLKLMHQGVFSKLTGRE